MPKINMGIEGLNEILGGGLEENKAYLITGDSGAGKTVFCLQFTYAGLKAGESAIYVTVDEKPKDIMEDAKSLGLDFDAYIKNNKLYILEMSPYITVDVGKGETLNIRRMITDLKELINKTSAKRVVIESIDYITLHTAESTVNAKEYLREIILSSTNLGYTMLITSALPRTEGELSIQGMAERLVDGVITLYIDEQRDRRLLYVRKMRKAGVKLSKYEYNINASGIAIKEIKKESAMIRIGEKIPDFSIEAYYNNKVVKLSNLDYLGKWLVLVFYPGDFTFVCPTELSKIAEMYDMFKLLDAEVISISMNTISSHKTWKETTPGIADIQYPMGSDLDGSVCNMFGILTREGTTGRAAFIIDPEGFMVAEEVNNDRIGRSISELLRMLSAAKYAREHPDEMCPEGWKPGEPTIKAQSI